VPKPPPALDHVFIDDAQGAEAHELGVVVVGKGEAEFGIEPAVVGVAAIGGFTNCKHWVFPRLSGRFPDVGPGQHFQRISC